MGRTRWPACAAVALLAALPYLRTLSFEFVFDDLHLIVHNTFLREAWSPFTAFVHHFWHGTPFGAAYYRPLVIASLALEGRMHGWSPAGFHLVNVLLHSANAVLLYALAKRLGCSERPALLGAMLFAMHPVAAWPVASVVARVDLLPALFILCAWLVLSTAGEGGGSRSRWMPLLAAVFFLSALLSKETALAFFAVPLLGLRRMSGPSASGETDGVTVAALIGALLTCLALRHAAGVPLRLPTGSIDTLTNPLAALAPSSRVPAALALTGRYLVYLVAPVRFADPRNYLDPATVPSFMEGGVVLATVALLTWAIGTVVLWLRRDPISLPLGFALVAFLPASNIVFPITSLYAQNFLYLPLLGLCVALGLVLERLEARAFLASSWRPVVAASVFTVLAIASLREAGIWRDEVSLLTAWTGRFPCYPPAHSALGVAYLEANEPRRAIAPLRRALALTDRSFEAHYNLGVALLRTGVDTSAWEEALTHLRRAAEIAPNQPVARANAARALLLLDRPSEAAEEARAALSVANDFAPAFEILVDSLIRAGDLAAARLEVERARGRYPENRWFEFCLARIEARSGNESIALSLLAAAIAHDPATRTWVDEVTDFDPYRGLSEFERLIAASGPRRH